MNEDILFLPVKPKWSNLIMSGHKVLELRKRVPRNGQGKPCVIYESSPTCQILGFGILSRHHEIVLVHAPTAKQLAQACVTREELIKYASGVEHVFALEIIASRSFAKPIPLKTMRTKWRLEPPQQWRYIDRKTFDEIVEAGR